MRLLPAPPSTRSEGSIRVRLLSLLITAIFAAACTSGGAGFTTGPQPTTGSAASTAAQTAAPATASVASSAAPSASTVVPSVSASVPASASASALSSGPASVSAAPSASAQPSVAPSSFIAPPSFTAAPVVYPLTLTDDENNQVVLKTEPKRLVSITPAPTEILFALGVGDRLVGNTDADDSPPQVKNLPHVATYSSVDVEKIVGLRADLVIAG